MTSQVVFVAVAVIIALVLGRLLRSGRLREKYAALWVVVGLGIVVVALWPGLLAWVSGLFGVVLPVNLLFFLALLLLLGVTLHLSLEASILEEEVRALAEHVAVLNLRVDELEGHVVPDEEQRRDA